MRLKLIARHMMPQLIDGESITSSWGRGVYRIELGTGKIAHSFTTPGRSLLSSLLGPALTTAPLRIMQKNPGISQVLDLRDGTISAIYDKVHVFEGEGGYRHGSRELSGSGFHGPLSCGALGASGDVWWGEYQNHGHAAIRIVRFSPANGRLCAAYTFPHSAIKHVHSISFDSFRNCYWVCTGDRDEECGLYYSNDDFRTLNCLGRGDQGWRMVSIVILKDRLVWGSDLGADVKDRHQTNCIYEYDFKTRQRRKLQEVDNPIYYSYLTPGGKILFGTTYEPGSVVGTSARTGILCSVDGASWKETVSFAFRPVKRSYGTRYATIFFPKGQGPDEKVYFTPYNVKEYDSCLMCLDLEKQLIPA